MVEGALKLSPHPLSITTLLKGKAVFAATSILLE